MAIDPATGAVDRVVSEAFGADGVFRQGLELVPDRTAAYYSEGYEDSWFACETAIGSVGRVDVATGDTELLYSGWSPTLSADGTRLAYLTASTCLPDPIQPDQFFVAPFDTVVVVDLATATQVEITTAQPPTGLDDPGALDWVVFEPSGDLLVVTVDDQVHRVPSTAPAVVQDQPVVISAFTAEPVGVVGNDLLALEYGDEGSSTLLSIDLDTEASTELWTSDGFVAAGVSAAGHVVASDPLGDGPITEGGLTVVTIDDFVFSIDW